MSGPPILYITGTNTGVGKTTLAIHLLRAARARNLRVAALKPFCSGGREDAGQLHALQTAGLTLDEVNPFHFRDPVSPLQAARNEGRRIFLADALTAMNTVHDRGFPLVIEGAGGLLSPLGEGFSLFDLIEKIPGNVCIVGNNVLGVLNAILLTARTLPTPATNQMVLLMAPAQADASTPSNSRLLQSLLPKTRVNEFPFIPQSDPPNVNSILDWWIR
jgi:dethiobiotin synthetase